MGQPRRRIPRNVLVVAFVALASGFGQDLITPVLPAYLALVGVSHAGIGLIDGLLQGSTSLFRFVSGILSDRFHNRKGFVFLGYALSSVSRPLLAIANTFGLVALLRFIDGTGKGMKDAPRDALVADSSSQAILGRAFGFHRLVDTSGSVFGPLTAGALLLALSPTLASYRLIFALAAIPGAIALTLIWFGVREPKQQPTKHVRSISKPLPFTFWMFTAATTLAMLAKINDSLFLIRTQELGVPSSWIPIVFAGFTLVYALLSYPIGIWSDRIGRLPMLAAGWITLTLVELGFAAAPSLPATLVLLVFYGVYYAFTEGSGRALIADLVPAESRGSAYAIFYTSVGVATVVGGFSLGNIWDTISPTTAFLVSAGGSFLSFLLLLALLRRRT